MTRLAVDLGGSRLRLGVGDGRGDWRLAFDRERPSEGGVRDIVDAVAEALSAWGLAPVDLAGIGVSVAGLVGPDGVVRRAENLGWRDAPLGAVLAEAFGRPVAVDTDVFCGARYEAEAGTARGAPAALYVALGTGIGHAFVFDGRVWRGSHGNANGFGHLVTDPKGPPCYCGGAGCLCLVAGGKAQAAADPPPGPIDALALAIGSAVTLIEPAVVVLGGGARSQPWFDLAALGEALGRRAYPGVVLPRLVSSRVDDANLRGAALLSEESE
ncbi:MAG: ROK family protein [Azospirillaceae bacterium]